MADDAPEDPPYLGMRCRSPSSGGELLRRALWIIVENSLFRWSPRPWHAWRAMLLGLFGASIDSKRQVVIFPSARVHFPWKLTLRARSMIGPRVTIYNLANITLEFGANVSQNCHLCAGTHDYRRWSMPLVTRPITIGRNAWIAADVFVGPGVHVGELAVVGARSVVVRDIPPRTVCAGNPCRPLHGRPEPEHG